MHYISKEILNNYQARKTKKQKKSFITYLCSECDKLHIPYQIESSGKFIKSNNIVFGNLENSKVVCGAHYDTAGAMLLPNMMFPLNSLNTIIVQLFVFMPIFILLALINPLNTFIIRTGLELITTLLGKNILSFFVYLFTILPISFILPIAVMYLYVMGITNKHTANDNTSGVTTILECIFTQQIDLTNNCFVLFDNEEIGLFGSRAFNKMHKIKLKDTVVLNFDCVSDGDTFFFKTNKNITTCINNQLKSVYTKTDTKDVIITQKGQYPSDNFSFPLGIGIAALNKSKFGLYLGRIHTFRDTVFKEENIRYLSEKTKEFMKDRKSVV